MRAPRAPDGVHPGRAARGAETVLWRPLSAICEALRRVSRTACPSAAQEGRPPSDHRGRLIWKGGKLLIDRRRPEGLLGGLWELPGGKVEPGETLAEALQREGGEETGVVVRARSPMMVVRHAYSHFRITMHVLECRHVSGRARVIECEAVRWVRPDELEQFAWPAANRKVVEAIMRDNRGRGRSALPFGSPLNRRTAEDATATHQTRYRTLSSQSRLFAGAGRCIIETLRRTGPIPSLRGGEGRSRYVMRFTKMHGIGNDYVYVDCFEPAAVADPAAPGPARSATATSASAATG